MVEDELGSQTDGKMGHEVHISFSICEKGVTMGLLQLGSSQCHDAEKTPPNTGFS